MRCQESLVFFDFDAFRPKILVEEAWEGPHLDFIVLYGTLPSRFHEQYVETRAKTGMVYGKAFTETLRG